MNNRKSLKNIKIILCLQSFEMGGAERQAIHLAEYLQYKEKANVLVLALTESGAASRLLDKLKIKWESLYLPKYSTHSKAENSIMELVVELTNYKPEIILTFTFQPNLLLNMFWKYTGAKVCIWNQADAGLGFGFISPETDNFKLITLKDKSYAFVSNSLEGKLFLEDYHSNEIDVNLIHNGIKLKEPIYSKLEWRDKIGLDENSFVAIKIANITIAKDHKTIIKAWKIVLNNWSLDSNPVLLLAGRFQHTYEELKGLVKELELQNHVFFLGHVDDISGLLNSSDIGVFSSISEGIPNGVLECMSAKLPVISTDLMGIREALGDNEEFLVPCGDSNAFADKILRLAKDPLKRKKVGTENYNRVINEFSLENMLTSYVDLIDKKFNV